MPLQIDLTDETEELTEKDISLVEELLTFAARKENIEESTELSVTFVNNKTIRDINKNYRQKDAETDVISFAMEEIGEGEIEIIGADVPRILGDIIISIPRTREQAIAYGHSFQRELGFLAVHGFLHLLGYDHLSEGEEKIMIAKQREILEEYGLKR